MRHHAAQEASMRDGIRGFGVRGYFLTKQRAAFLAIIALSCSAWAQSPVPTNTPANYPAWWFARNVIAQKTPTNVSPSWPSNYPASSDFSVINQGQLKTMAIAANAELQARLPSAVLTNSNAIALQSLVATWTTNPSTNANNYAVVNNGQLKYLAKQFYDVLGSGSYTAGRGQPTNWTNGTYPWSLSTNAAKDYASANIGDAKYLFSFDLSAPTNQVPAWWSQYYFGNTNATLVQMQAVQKYHWNQAQARSFAALQSNNPSVPVTGLRIWFKADGVSNGITTDTNGRVLSWSDQTGYYSVSNSSVGQQPLLITNSAMYGVPAVRFGVNKVLQNQAVSWDSSMANPITQIVVGMTTNRTAQQYAIYLGGGDDDAGRGLGYYRSAQAFDIWGQWVGGATASSNGVYTAEAASIDFIEDGREWQTVNLYRDGKLQNQGTLWDISGQNNGLYIGAESPDANFSWQGDIAEVLVYDHQLSTNEMSQVTTYLRGKYPIWVQDYSPDIQSTILKHQWNQAQASNYVALQSNNLGLPAAGLTAWFKPDQGVISDTNGHVSAWADQVTGRYTVSNSTTSQQPTLVTNVMNGMPVVRFNGAQAQGLANASVAADSGLGADMTMIVVGCTTNNAASQYSVTLGTQSLVNSTQSRAFGCYLSYQYLDVEGNFAFGSNAPQNGTYTMEALSLDAGLDNVTFYRNGNQSGQFGIYGVGTPVGGFALGGGYAPGNPWQGDIAEVLIYDHQLSAGEMAQVSLYMVAKYGLYVPGAAWIQNYTSAQQAWINTYQWSKTQADYYLAWLPSYSTSMQGIILKHQWNQTQAASYAAMASNNPTMLTTGLSAWFKADTGISTTNGNVSAWADLVTGTYSVSNNTVGQQPALVTNALNGKPIIRFNASQVQGLSNSVAPADPGLNADMTEIVVGCTTNGGQQQYAVSLGAWGSDRTRRALGDVWGYQLMDTYNVYALGTNTVDNGVYTAEAWTLDPSTSNVSFYRDGMAVKANALNGTPVNLSSGFYIGEAAPSSYNWQGDIAEVLVYDHQLSSNEMAQVNAYLTGKYALVQAPVITPNGGSNTYSITASISAASSNNQIRYTLDGNAPSNSSTIYSNSITLTNSATLSAGIFANGKLVSPTSSASYDIESFGISTNWQQQYFGHVGIDPNALSPCGDNYTLLQEFQYGRNPLDYYQGVLPTLFFISGGGQIGSPGTTLPVPVSVLVNWWGQSHAPITLSVQSGHALLSVNGSTPAQSVLVNSSTSYGGTWVAQASVVLPNISGETNIIAVTASSGGATTIPITTAVFVANTSLQQPGGLQALPLSGTTTHLTWSSDTNQPTSIQYSTDQGTNWSWLQVVPAGVNDMILTNSFTDQLILYRVSAGDYSN